MSNKIYISEFDSEARLRCDETYSLPRIDIFGGSNRLLMRGIDGLTLTMAEDGDTVITSEKLSDAYLAYWQREICRAENYSPGFPAENRITGRSDSEDSSSVYETLTRDEDARSLLEGRSIVNYALVPAYYEMCKALGIESDEPGLETVTLLNSKAYSNELKEKLGLPAAGIRVRSIEEYKESVSKLLSKHGKALIKDVMGVSGRGMLLIDSAGMVERLASHFEKQQDKGMKIFDFILEPVLEKEMDFSCLFRIDKSGAVAIDGYQKNLSKGFAYFGTEPLSAEELERILDSPYPETVMRIARDMAEKGYHGYACIDSMIADGQVVPLIEINPRMSLSRFNLALQEKLGVKCRLSYREGRRAEDINAEKLLRILDEEGILYTAEREKGVIPLAPCTWDVPGASGKKVRIYYLTAADKQEDYEEILDSWLAHCSGSICAGRIT